MSQDSVTTRKRIVVGVDGSPQSKEVLRWAVDQARATDDDVTAVMAWQVPVAYGYGDMLAIRDSAEKSLQDVINTVSDPDVTITSRFVEGAAAAVLIEEGKSADLLVVGSRGRGGFAGLLLGSVSTQCVHHAECPVVVIRSHPVE
jgi:nucleotide-binding universal stress UspA family protein